MRRAAVSACALIALTASTSSRADTYTLADLIANQGSITTGGYTFSNFRDLTLNPGTFSNPQSPGGGPAATVTADGSGLTFTGNLAFAYGQTIGGGSFLFTVTVAGGPLIGSEFLTATASLSSVSSANQSPPLAVVSAGGLGLSFNNPLVQQDYTGTKSTSKMLTSGFESIDVAVNTTAYGYVSRGFFGSAELSSMTFSVGAIPEPGPLLLALAGLAAVAARRITRRR